MHGRVADRPDGEIGRIPVHDGLGRDAVGSRLQPRGGDGVGLADGQVGEDAVADL